MLNIRDLWPCLDESGLRVFTTTADQRYELGEDVFLGTHFPIRLRRFPVEMTPQDVDEDALLRRLCRTSGIRPGNRVFILYGAAGSGKSELMRWLQVQIAQVAPVRSKAAVRIPRTELNVLHIAERFQHMLSGQYFSDSTHQRWEQAASKPRTLAKLLLLTALERCLNSDEQINTLYYRLLAWIEPRIVRSLRVLIEEEGEETTRPELLTREDFEELQSETSLSIPLDYEQFRYHLTQAFREHLMEGLYLPDILQRVSANLAAQGQRPVLLIDDLVQSINLFATELLDYFITLNTGNWDVIIGLTPAALAASARGQELLDRISYLDTVDDRVVKLWLSDIQGSDSYFLSQESCAEFAANYLRVYRFYNGWQCTTCEHRPRCCKLGAAGDSLLAPFNHIVLQRLFQNLPSGKGKARQFLHRIHAVLEGAANNEGLLPILRKFIKPKFVVEAENHVYKELAELYGSLVNRRQVKLQDSLLQAFELSNAPLALRAEPISERPSYFTDMIQEPEQQDSPGKTAIRAWLEGQAINRQSLLPLRKGVARWLNTVLSIRAFHARGVAQPHMVLRWSRVYLGVNPPIVFQDVDEEEGILVTREIGLTAFKLHDFSSATGDTRNALIASLAREQRLIPLLHDAVNYHAVVRARLEEQLGISVEQLASALYAWLAVAQEVDNEYRVGFGASFWEQIKAERSQLLSWGQKLEMGLSQSLLYLFDDFFRLRKGVYDGPGIAQRVRVTTVRELLDTLLSIELEHLDKDYRLSRESLSDILKKVQSRIRLWRQPRDKEEALSGIAQATLERLMQRDKKGVLLHEIPTEVFVELQVARPKLYQSLRVIILNSLTVK